MSTEQKRHVRDLEQQLDEARATIAALLSGEIDAVVDSSSQTPVLLVKAQDALRTAEERMRFALEAADVGIWDMDPISGSIRWSERLEAQHGLEPGTFGGTLDAFIERVHPEDRASVLETLGNAMTSGADFSFQNRSLRPDGSIRWLNGAGRFHLGERGEAVRGLGVSMDVTERRLLEDQYRQAQKMEAVGRLASGVAHDFNNLLTVILGSTEFVMADVSLAARHGKDLGEAVKAAQRAAGLTRQLLAFSRQQILRAVPIDVNDLITDMTGMLVRLIGENVETSLALAPDLSLALADRGQVEQVVMNLVVNARDAMPGGGRVTIQTANVELENSSFHQDTVMDGRYVMLAITDNGIGMSKETTRRLFEPFFTTKEIGHGTGLGLSTTYGIVKQSKGYIWVYSEPGRGTTFKVYLPTASGDAVRRIVPAPPAAPAPRASETVLLVEDEDGVRRLTKRILENAGFTVLAASNGDEAERLFRLHAASIDLLVADVVMPGCGGPELFRRLQSQAPALRVLFMSGYTEHSAVGAGGFDPDLPFVQKPFTGAVFLQHVRDALG